MRKPAITQDLTADRISANSDVMLTPSQFRDGIREILNELKRMEQRQMAVFQDVQTAADKAAAADAQVVTAVAGLKASIAQLQAQIAALPPGPTSDQLQAVADELNKGTDNITAAIASS